MDKLNKILKSRLYLNIFFMFFCYFVFKTVGFEFMVCVALGSLLGEQCYVAYELEKKHKLLKIGDILECKENFRNSFDNSYFVKTQKYEIINMNKDYVYLHNNDSAENIICEYDYFKNNINNFTKIKCNYEN